MPPQALIFDFNGVLVDDEPVHFRLFRDILARQGQPLTETDYFGRYFVYDDAGVFAAVLADRGHPQPPERIEALRQEKARLYAAVPSTDFHYFEGAEDLARDASRSLPLAIASGARRAEVLRHLEARGLAGIFRIVVSIDDVSKGKPDPEPFLEAARQLRVPPASCIAIEDSPGGIQAARAAGMKVIGVCHTVPADRLPADIVLQRLDGVRWADLARRL